MPETTGIKCFLKSRVTIPQKGIISLFFLFIFFSAIGCLSVDENIYKVNYTTRKTIENNIEVLYWKPKRKYIIFGDITVRYNSGYKRELAINYLRKTAAKYGADGIIMNPIRRINDKWSVSNNNNEDSRSLQLETYILSGSIFQYLPE